MMNKELKLILASKSPRRHELIKGIEVNAEIKTYEVDESFPDQLKAGEIALHLAEKKANAYPDALLEHQILLTADTIVWINNRVLNKPADEKEAFEMLQMLRGAKHEVYTGVCLRSNNQQFIFVECSEVWCRNISDEHIHHYIKQYKPFDKAGSYGIQDWFGYTAVEKINGCFFNVMGLPIGKVYEYLSKFDF
jgi:septum formation protein